MRRTPRSSARARHPRRAARRRRALRRTTRHPQTRRPRQTPGRASPAHPGPGHGPGTLTCHPWSARRASPGPEARVPAGRFNSSPGAARREAGTLRPGRRQAAASRRDAAGRHVRLHLPRSGDASETPLSSRPQVRALPGSATRMLELPLPFCRLGAKLGATQPSGSPAAGRAEHSAMQATRCMTDSRTCDNTSKRRFHPDTDVDSSVPAIRGDQRAGGMAGCSPKKRMNWALASGPRASV